MKVSEMLRPKRNLNWLSSMRELICPCSLVVRALQMALIEQF
jgi:hypothetical protein